MTEIHTDETFEPGTESVTEPQVSAGVHADESDGPATARKLLRRAARIAAKYGGGLDAFVTAAYRAYLEANPEERERIEEAQVLAQLEALRRDGRIGLA